MGRVFGWSIIVVINVSVVFAAWKVMMSVANDYIERQRELTLIYDAHPLRRQRLKPGQRFNGKVRFTINQHGLRGVAPTAVKPDGETRIFVMGGSSVFDHHLPEKKSWPEKIATLLQTNAGKTIQTFNAGVPGFSSRETFAHYFDKIRYMSPDIVLLYHGWNDVKYMNRFLNQVDVDRFYTMKRWSEVYRHLIGPEPWRQLYAIQKMIESEAWDFAFVREAAARSDDDPGPSSVFPKSEKHFDTRLPSLVTDWKESGGMSFFRSNLEAFVREVRADGAIPVLVVQATLVTRALKSEDVRRVAFRYVSQDLLNLLAINHAMAETVLAVGQDMNVHVIDPRGIMDGVDSYFVDHVHLSAAGSDEVARFVAQKLAPVLGEEVQVPVRCCVWDFEREKSLQAKRFDSLEFQSVGEAMQLADGTLVFPGKEDSYFELPSQTSLHLPSRFSIQADIFLDKEAPVERIGVVVKPGSYHLTIRDGRLAFKAYGFAPDRWFVGSEQIATGKWVRLAVEKGVDGLEMYADDVLIGKWNVQGAPAMTSRPLILGGSNGALKGRIKRVSVGR